MDGVGLTSACTSPVSLPLGTADAADALPGFYHLVLGCAHPVPDVNGPATDAFLLSSVLLMFIAQKQSDREDPDSLHLPGFKGSCKFWVLVGRVASVGMLRLCLHGNHVVSAVFVDAACPGLRGVNGLWLNRTEQADSDGGPCC